MENQQDKSQLIKNCAISFLCVCEQLLDDDQLKSWANYGTNPNDYMDANVVLDQVMVNHGIDTFNEDGEISDEITDLFNGIFNRTNELNAEKRKIRYSVEDMHFSIHDIFEQFEAGKITRSEAKVLVNRCCYQFSEDNK